MSKTSATIKSTSIGIAILVLISRGIGFVREMVIAYRFGTGIEYDVYWIAVTIPLALYALFGYSLANITIPNYTKAKASTHRDGALRIIWTEFNLSMVMAGIFVVILIVAAAPILRLIAPGMDEKYLPDAVLITRVSSVIILFAVAEAFFRSVLNAEKNFLIPAAAPILANLIMIASILLFAGSLSTEAILYGMVIGYLAQVAINYFPFRKIGMFKSWQARIWHDSAGKYILALLLIMAIEGSSQVYAVADRYFASSLETGVVSSLGYSYLLIMLPVSVFAFALSTAIFPYMSDAFAGKDPGQGAYLVTRGIVVSLLLAVPATFVFWLFGKELILILLRRGAFTLKSVAFTSGLLRYLALGLAGQFLLWVMARAYYAAGKYYFLIVQVIVMLAIKVIGAALLVPVLGYIGLAVSSTISYTAGALLLVAVAPWLVARIDVRHIFVYVIKLAIASVPAGIAGFYLHAYFVVPHTEFWPLLIRLVPSLAIVLILFLAAGYVLNIGEIRDLKSFLMRSRQA